MGGTAGGVGRPDPAVTKRHEASMSAVHSQSHKRHYGTAELASNIGNGSAGSAVSKCTQSTRDFQNQTVMTVTAIFIDGVQVVACAPGFSEAGRRAVQICDEGSAFTHGFMVSGFRPKTSTTNGSGRVCLIIEAGPCAPILYVTVVFGPPSKILVTSATAASWSLQIGEPRNCPARKSRNKSRPK